MSGSLTISNSGVPVRFRSMRLSALPAASSCMLLPASSSKCARMMPTRFGSKASLGIADFQIAVVRKRQIVLADLIALGQVGIVIILAVPLGERRDLAIQRHGRLQRQFERLAIHHRQRAGHADADRARLRVRRRAELRAAPAEQLALGEQLHVHFQADDGGVGSVIVDALLSLQRRFAACASRWPFGTCGRRAAGVLLPAAGLAVAGRWAGRLC